MLDGFIGNPAGWKGTRRIVRVFDFLPLLPAVCAPLANPVRPIRVSQTHLLNQPWTQYASEHLRRRSRLIFGSKPSAELRGAACAATYRIYEITFPHEWTINDENSSSPYRSLIDSSFYKRPGNSIMWTPSIEGSVSRIPFNRTFDHSNGVTEENCIRTSAILPLGMNYGMGIVFDNECLRRSQTENGEFV